MAAQKSCMETYCMKTRLQPQMKFLKKMDINSTIRKEDIESCRKSYCNPGCKGTLFESGKKLSKSFRKNLTRKMGKNAKSMFGYFDQTRKNLFKGRNTVLKNDFYEGLPSKKIAYAKKKGAISGCVQQIT